MHKKERAEAGGVGCDAPTFAEAVGNPLVGREKVA